MYNQTTRIYQNQFSVQQDTAQYSSVTQLGLTLCNPMDTSSFISIGSLFTHFSNLCTAADWGMSECSRGNQIDRLFSGTVQHHRSIYHQEIICSIFVPGTEVPALPAWPHVRLTACVWGRYHHYSCSLGDITQTQVGLVTSTTIISVWQKLDLNSRSLG